MTSNLEQRIAELERQFRELDEANQGCFEAYEYLLERLILHSSPYTNERYKHPITRIFDIPEMRRNSVEPQDKAFCQVIEGIKNALPPENKPPSAA